MPRFIIKSQRVLSAHCNSTQNTSLTRLAPDKLVLVVGVEMSVGRNAAFTSQLRAESQDSTLRADYRARSALTPSMSRSTSSSVV